MSLGSQDPGAGMGQKISVKVVRCFLLSSHLTVDRGPWEVVSILIGPFNWTMPICQGCWWAESCQRQGGTAPPRGPLRTLELSDRWVHWDSDPEGALEILELDSFIVRWGECAGESLKDLSERLYPRPLHVFKWFLGLAPWFCDSKKDIEELEFATLSGFLQMRLDMDCGLQRWLGLWVRAEWGASLTTISPAGLAQVLSPGGPSWGTSWWNPLSPRKQCTRCVLTRLGSQDLVHGLPLGPF